MSPKTWMRTVYFQIDLKLDILAQLGVGYLKWKVQYIVPKFEIGPIILCQTF